MPKWIERSNVGMVAITTWRMLYRYPLNIVNLFIVPITFLAITFVFSRLLDNERFQETAGGEVSLVAYAMVGLGVFALTNAALGMGAIVEAEVSWGTLPANLVTPVRPIVYIGGVCAASLAGGSLLTLSLSLIGVLLLPARVELVGAVLSLILAVSLYFGIGLIVAALALRFKRIGATASAVATILQFVTGAFIPVRSLPDWLSVVAFAMPPTWAIDLVRAQLLGIPTLLELHVEFVLVALLAAVALAGGGLAVSSAVEWLRRHGGLEAY